MAEQQEAKPVQPANRHSEADRKRKLATTHSVAENNTLLHDCLHV